MVEFVGYFMVVVIIYKLVEASKSTMKSKETNEKAFDSYDRYSRY